MMKCENCGNNEVTFVYRSNINGHVTEKHLCSTCARELGYTDQLAAHNRSMMRNFWSDGWMGKSLLDGFFAPNTSLLGRMMEDPFDDFFREMPALRAASVQEEPKQDDLIEKEAQSRFARMRQLNAMRHEMKKAIREENFERAAELRDEIRKLEDTRESA